MDRRGFLSSSVKAGAAAAVAASPAATALALSEERRRALWYASHCWGCGFPYCPKWLATQNPPSKYQFCEWCRWHKMPTETMAVPGDWYPGMYEDPTAKAYL